MNSTAINQPCHAITRLNGLSVKFHATGAREQLGFVAEVVTMPISVVAADRDVKHNVSFSVFEVKINPGRLESSLRFKSPRGIGQ